MERVYSHYNLEELREIRKAVDSEIEKRKNQLREELFNTMMKAIREFEEVHPDAKVCDYEMSYSIHYMADRDNWNFD